VGEGARHGRSSGGPGCEPFTCVWPPGASEGPPGRRGPPAFNETGFYKDERRRRLAQRPGAAEPASGLRDRPADREEALIRRPPSSPAPVSERSFPGPPSLPRRWSGVGHPFILSSSTSLSLQHSTARRPLTWTRCNHSRGEEGGCAY
jgi:hypothetical protein